MMGEILTQKAKTADELIQARQVVRSVLAKAPGRRDDRKRAIELSMKLGDHAAAANDLQVLLEHTGVGDVSDLEYQLGECREAMRVFDQAIEHYERAIATSPKNVAAYAAAARLIRSEAQDPKRADVLMEKLVEANPSSAHALKERGLYRKANSQVGAKADLAAARKLDPQDPEVLLAAIELGTRTWDKDEVQKLRTDLAASLKAHPKDARLRLAEATLFAQNGQLDEAVQSLNKAIEIDPDALNQRWLLADMLIDLKRLREAEELVNDLRKRDVRAEITDFLEARIKMTREEWSAALVILERIRGLFQELPGARGQVGRIDLMLGRVYEAIGGEPERREQAYRRALNSDPESVEARLGLARTLSERSQFDEAIGLYRSLVSTNPAFLVDVARTTLLATLAVPKERRDWRALQKAIDDATPPAGDSPVVPLIQADMLNAQGKFDQAVALLEKAKAAHPEQIEPWLAIAESMAAQDKLDDAQLRLDDAQKALGDRAEIRLARARYLTRSKGKKAADEDSEVFRGTSKKFPAVSQRKLLTGLAVDFALLGATDQASILWKKMAALFPTDLGSPCSACLTSPCDAKRPQGDGQDARGLIRAVEGQEGRPLGYLLRGADARRESARSRGDPTALERAALARHGPIQTQPELESPSRLATGGDRRTQ